MARHKPKDTPVLVDLAQADDTLKALAAIEREIDLIASAAEEAIDKIKADAKAETIPLTGNRKLLEAALEQYAIHHPEQFETPRSRNLTFGVIGFRKSSGKFKPLRAWTWEKVLKHLRAFGPSKYLRRKYEVDRETLEKDYRAKKITHDSIAVFGLKWDVRDEFYYEVVKDVEDADAA